MSNQAHRTLASVPVLIVGGGPVDLGVALEEARYLVGCDGSSSTVRRTLGISMLGDAVLSYSTGIYFTAPDLARYHKMGLATRYWLVGEVSTGQLVHGATI